MGFDIKGGINIPWLNNGKNEIGLKAGLRIRLWNFNSSGIRLCPFDNQSFLKTVNLK